MSPSPEERSRARDRELLERLRREPGQFVSGTELAELLGVSRAAVGKRVAGLRAQGWEIEAVPNRGYRLCEPDELTAGRVTPLLNTAWLGRLYLMEPRLPSTSDEARRRAEEGAPHGTVVVADGQSAGRGRHGRAWHSPRGVNLHLSIVLRAEQGPPLAAAPALGLAAAVGIAEALRGFVGRPPVVKWPNDLLYDGRKLAGILLETSSGGPGAPAPVILGVGINVNQAEFPDELRDRATSLRCQRGDRADRAAVLAALLNSLEPWIERLASAGFEPVRAAWLALAPWIGEPVQVCPTPGQPPVRGVALGLDAHGGLRLRLGDGSRHIVRAGDLELLDSSRG